MRKVQFANGHFYHIYNRGIEKRNVFFQDNDYLRFLTGLAEFNTIAPIELKLIFDKRYKNGPKSITKIKSWKNGEPFVKIHAFCLMPNHFHLLAEQIIDGGISAFMHKLGIGYSMYINKKRERVGSLFQGTFKAILIDKEIYLTHLLRYIHLNPVELIDSNWKNKGINNWAQTIKFLESYKWSSFHDYNGKAIYSDIVSRNFLLELLGGSQGHRQFLKDWLVEKDNENIDDLTFE